MLIRDAYNRFVANLIESNIPEPKLKCSILFCEILKLDKAQLFSHMDDEIYEGDFIELSSKVNMLLNNAPIQYVIGHQEFMSLDFLVTSEVPVSYTHLRAHETRHDLVCRLLLEKKKK